MSNVMTIDHEPERSAPAPISLLDRAVSAGASIEIIERLMALQERNDANQARKAFDAAMSAAKAEIPVIVKNRTVDFTSARGRTNYRHEDLGEIARTVDPILAKHGLSYRFRTTSMTNEPVCVTCIVSHRDGHSEENTLSAGRDESGNKNSIQSIGSTITYLQRYTLKAALGLAASNDDDARATETSRTLNAAELATISTLIDETNSDIELFCKNMQVEFLAEITVDKLPIALGKLNAKKAKQAREAQA